VEGFKTILGLLAHPARDPALTEMIFVTLAKFLQAADSSAGAAAAAAAATSDAGLSVGSGIVGVGGGFFLTDVARGTLSVVAAEVSRFAPWLTPWLGGGGGGGGSGGVVDAEAGGDQSGGGDTVGEAVPAVDTATAGDEKATFPPAAEALAAVLAEAAAPTPPAPARQMAGESEPIGGVAEHHSVHGRSVSGEGGAGGTGGGGGHNVQDVMRHQGALSALTRTISTSASAHEVAQAAHMVLMLLRSNDGAAAEFGALGGFTAMRRVMLRERPVAWGSSEEETEMLLRRLFDTFFFLISDGAAPSGAVRCGPALRCLADAAATVRDPDAAAETVRCILDLLCENPASVVAIAWAGCIDALLALAEAPALALALAVAEEAVGEVAAGAAPAAAAAAAVGGTAGRAGGGGGRGSGGAASSGVSAAAASSAEAEVVLLRSTVHPLALACSPVDLAGVATAALAALRYAGVCCSASPDVAAAAAARGAADGRRSVPWWTALAPACLVIAARAEDALGLVHGDASTVRAKSAVEAATAAGDAAIAAAMALLDDAAARGFDAAGAGGHAGLLQTAVALVVGALRRIVPPPCSSPPLPGHGKQQRPNLSLQEPAVAPQVHAHAAIPSPGAGAGIGAAFFPVSRVAVDDDGAGSATSGDIISPSVRGSGGDGGIGSAVLSHIASVIMILARVALRMSPRGLSSPDFGALTASRTIQVLCEAVMHPFATMPFDARAAAVWTLRELVIVGAREAACGGGWAGGGVIALFVHMLASGTTPPVGWTPGGSSSDSFCMGASAAAGATGATAAAGAATAPATAPADDSQGHSGHRTAMPGSSSSGTLFSWKSVDYSPQIAAARRLVLQAVTLFLVAGPARDDARCATGDVEWFMWDVEDPHVSVPPAVASATSPAMMSQPPPPSSAPAAGVRLAPRSSGGSTSAAASGDRSFPAASIAPDAALSVLKSALRAAGGLTVLLNIIQECGEIVNDFDAGVGTASRIPRDEAVAEADIAFAALGEALTDCDENKAAIGNRAGGYVGFANLLKDSSLRLDRHAFDIVLETAVTVRARGTAFLGPTVALLGGRIAVTDDAAADAAAESAESGTEDEGAENAGAALRRVVRAVAADVSGDDNESAVGMSSPAAAAAQMALMPPGLLVAAATVLLPAVAYSGALQLYRSRGAVATETVDDQGTGGGGSEHVPRRSSRASFLSVSDDEYGDTEVKRGASFNGVEQFTHGSSASAGSLERPSIQRSGSSSALVRPAHSAAPMSPTHKALVSPRGASKREMPPRHAVLRTRDAKAARRPSHLTLAAAMARLVFRSTEAALMPVLLVPCAPQRVQVSVLGVLGEIMDACPMYCRALCDMQVPGLLLRLVQRLAPRLRPLYLQLLARLLAYDVRPHEAKLLFQLAQLSAASVAAGHGERRGKQQQQQQVQHVGVSSPQTAQRTVQQTQDALRELQMQLLFVIGTLCDRRWPRHYFEFRGGLSESSGHLRLSVDRFPSTKTGYSVTAWLRIEAFAAPETSLMSICVGNDTVLEVIFAPLPLRRRGSEPAPRLGVVPAGSSGAAAATAAAVAAAAARKNEPDRASARVLCVRCCAPESAVAAAAAAVGAGPTSTSAAAAAAMADAGAGNMGAGVRPAEIYSFERYAWMPSPRWRHLTLTHNGSSMCVYVDGVPTQVLYAPIAFPAGVSRERPLTVYVGGRPRAPRVSPASPSGEGAHSAAAPAGAVGAGSGVAAAAAAAASAAAAESGAGAVPDGRSGGEAAGDSLRGLFALVSSFSVLEGTLDDAAAAAAASAGVDSTSDGPQPRPVLCSLNAAAHVTDRAAAAAGAAGPWRRGSLAVNWHEEHMASVAAAATAASEVGATADGGGSGGGGSAAPGLEARAASVTSPARRWRGRSRSKSSFTPGRGSPTALGSNIGFATIGEVSVSISPAFDGAVGSAGADVHVSQSATLHEAVEALTAASEGGLEPLPRSASPAPAAGDAAVEVAQGSRQLKHPQILVLAPAAAAAAAGGAGSGAAASGVTAGAPSVPAAAAAGGTASASGGGAHGASTAAGAGAAAAAAAAAATSAAHEPAPSSDVASWWWRATPASLISPSGVAAAGVEVHHTSSIADALASAGGLPLLFPLLVGGAAQQVSALRILAGLLDRSRPLFAQFVSMRGWWVLEHLLCARREAWSTETFDVLLDVATGAEPAPAPSVRRHRSFNRPDCLTLVCDLIFACEALPIQRAVVDMLTDLVEGAAANVDAWRRGPGCGLILDWLVLVSRLSSAVRGEGSRMRSALLQMLRTLLCAASLSREELSVVVDFVAANRTDRHALAGDVLGMLLELLQGGNAALLEHLNAIAGWILPLALLESPAEGLRLCALRLLTLMLHAGGVKAREKFEAAGGVASVGARISVWPCTQPTCAALIGLLAGAVKLRSGGGGDEAGGGGGAGAGGGGDESARQRLRARERSRGRSGSDDSGGGGGGRGKRDDRSRSREPRASAGGFGGGGGDIEFLNASALEVLLSVLKRCSEEPLIHRVLDDVQRALTPSRCVHARANIAAVLVHRDWLRWFHSLLVAAESMADHVRLSEADRLSWDADVHSGGAGGEEDGDGRGVVDAVYGIIRTLMLVDMEAPPRTDRPFLSVLKMLDAEAFQVAVIGGVYSGLCAAPVLAAETAPNVLRNLAALTEAAADLVLPPHVLMSGVEAVNALAVANGTEVRSRMKESGVLDARDSLVLACLRGCGGGLDGYAMALASMEPVFDTVAPRGRFREANGVQAVLRLFIVAGDARDMQLQVRGAMAVYVWLRVCPCISMCVCASLCVFVCFFLCVYVRA
jgi:hypothetical protein